MSVPIFVEFRGGLTDFVAKMGIANAEIDKLALKGAGAGAKMATAGKAAALGITGLAVGVAAVSVKMAGDFQQATNVLVTAAGESTKNLALVRKGILDISTSTGTTWQQVTDGLYLLEKAGYRGADALKVEKAAAQGAREEGADLGTVTQALTSIMASYHLKASDAVKVTNEMKTAAGESKTTMETFAGSLSTVLPLASANKIAFADIAGSLASLTQHGTSADEAAQELAFTMRGLSAPNMVAQKEMAQLGISSNDVSQKLGDGPGGRGLAGTLNYLSKTVLEKMGPSGKVLLSTFNASQTAAKDAATEMAALPEGVQKLAQQYVAGAISLKDWNSAVKGLPGPQASLAKQWATTENSAKGFQSAIKSGVSQSQTYSDAIKKMVGGAAGLNTVLQLTGESAAGTAERIKRISDSAKGAGDNVSGWASTQNLMNVRMDMWKQSIEAAAIKLGMFLIPYVLQAMDAIQGLAGWFEKHRQVALAVAGVIGGVLAVVIAAYIASMVAAAAATVAATWPILAIIAAVAGLAAGLVYAYQHSQTFRDIVNGAATDVKRIAGEVFNWLANDSLPALKSAFHVAWQAAGDVIQWFIDNPLKWIRDRVGEFQAFWHAHGQEIKDIAHTAWTFISRTVDVAWTLIWDGILKPGLKFLEQMWKPTWEVLADTVKLVWGLIKNFTTTGYQLVMGVVGVFLDLLDGHWSKAWNGLKKTVADLWTNIKALVGGFVTDAGTLLVAVGKALIQGLINGIGDAVGGVKNAIDDVGHKAVGWAKGVLGIHSPSVIFLDIGHNVMDAMAQGIREKEAAVKAALEKTLQTLKDSAAQMAKTVADSFKSAGSLSDIFNGAANGGYGTDEATLATQLQARMDGLSAFAQQVKQLKAAGLNDTELQDIIGQGASVGGQIASSVLASGAAGIAQLNNIQGQYDAQATAIGVTAAGSTYGKQIAATEVHIHMDGTFVGASKADGDILGQFVAQGVRTALLSMKAAGGIGTIGLA